MSIFEAFPGSDAEFNGEYYDSQTEAAWAAYLELHDVTFEHEPATYKLPFGQIYTPDFYLTEMHAFVEVKNGNADNLAAYKMSLLTYTTQKQGFIVNGKPHYANVFVYTPEWTFKPTNFHEPHYDQKLTLGASPTDKSQDIWLPDRDKEPEMFDFAVQAAKRAGQAFQYEPSIVAQNAHINKREQLRLPENIVDLSDTPMPEDSRYYFSYPEMY